MINIKYNPKTMRITIKGHAGTAPAGQDIVCAGVSAVFYNLANVLKYYPDDAWKKPIEFKDESGNAALKVYPKAELEANVRHEYAYCFIGFQMLAEAYPERIQFDVVPAK